MSLHRMIAKISYKLSYKQQTKVQILTLLSSKISIWALFTLKVFQKRVRMSEKCRDNNKRNNNSDKPLTSRRTDGGKNVSRVLRAHPHTRSFMSMHADPS